MTTARITGALGGMLDIAILQVTPLELPPVEKATVYILSSALVIVFTTKLVAAITKLTELPSKKEWIELNKNLADVSSGLGKHLAAYDEWKKSTEHRLEIIEDK